MSSPLKAIRKKCIECSGGSYKEVRLCPCDDCPLWPYRFGRKPQKTDEQGYIEFKPRRKENAVWGIRTHNWTRVVYVFEQDGAYKVDSNTFAKNGRGLKLAKQKAREGIKK